MRMIFQQFRDRSSQRASAVPMNYPHLTQTCKRSLVKKLINRVDGFVGCLPNHINFRAAVLLPQVSDGLQCPATLADSQTFPFSTFDRRRQFNSLKILQLLPETQRLHAHFGFVAFDAVDNSDRTKRASFTLSPTAISLRAAAAYSGLGRESSSNSFSFLTTSPSRITRTPRPLVLAGAAASASLLSPALVARCASRFSSATRR